MATYQVRTNASGQKILSEPLSGLSSTLATSELPGAVQPDGVTTKVDSVGVLSAIGGNLQLNDEIWITESGTFTAPVTGWYEILLIGGGGAGHSIDNVVFGGQSGDYTSALIFLSQGQEVAAIIGSGGISAIIESGALPATVYGGATTFGELSSTSHRTRFQASRYQSLDSSGNLISAAMGGGFGGSYGEGVTTFYGAGGSGTKYVGSPPQVSNGAQGAIRLRFWNPAKAAGPSE